MVNYSKKSLRVLFFLGIFLLSGCVWPLTTITQNPDADSSIASIVIADAQAARDAGMLYIRDHYGLYVPPAGSAWIEQNITPEGVVGTSAFQFNIDHWVVNIIYPMVNPAELIFSISVHNPTTGFTWEGQVDAFGIVIETARPNDANRATKSPTPTTSVTPSAVSSTQIFSDSTYRFSVQYPSDWALTISPAGYVTSSGGFAAKSINLTKDGYTLKIQYKFLWEKTELGESLPSGTLEVRGPATLLGRQIPQQVIVDQGQDKVSFYGDSIDDISYHIRLETQADSLPAEIQQIAAQIVSAITRTGPIVSSPTPTLTPSITVTPSPTSKLDASKSGVGSNSTVSEDCNLANFISHVTIPEGAAVPAGARFIKTWRVQNVGTCTWTTAYSLQYSYGDAVDGDEKVPFPEEVPPGAAMDISVVLTAPDKEGEYDNYWVFYDNYGFWFGTGAAKRGTLPLIINIIKPNYNFAYDFASNYCDATWKNRDMTENPVTGYVLDCPGEIGNPDGFVALLANPAMEHRTDDEITLWVHPNEARYGWIQGTYPKYTVQNGDHFKAMIGCMANNQGCSLDFELYYKDSGGTLRNLGEWFEDYNEQATSINLDLSALAGQEVRFVLRTVALTKNTSVAQGFWFVPRIERSAVAATATPAGTQTPTPTPTPTPSPTASPSETPSLTPSETNTP